MSVLQNKIDFAVILSVNNANPNGDPLNGNRPRENYDGYGEISDVCLKRKIRNRWQDLGQKIFVQAAERADDGYNSLKERAEKELSEDDRKDRERYAREACKKWLDVRSFGQVFAFDNKNDDEEKGKGVSVGVRGPVTVQSAMTVLPVNIDSMQITKSVNGRFQITGYHGYEAPRRTQRLCFLRQHQLSAGREDGFFRGRCGTAS